MVFELVVLELGFVGRSSFVRPPRRPFLSTSRPPSLPNADAPSLTLRPPLSHSHDLVLRNTNKNPYQFSGRRPRRKARLHHAERPHHRLQHPRVGSRSRVRDLPHVRQREAEGSRARGKDGEGGTGEGREGGDGGNTGLVFFGREGRREPGAKEKNSLDFRASLPFLQKKKKQTRLETLQRAEDEKTAKRRAKRQKQKVCVEQEFNFFCLRVIFSVKFERRRERSFNTLLFL